jgi:hypothetical protein
MPSLSRRTFLVAGASAAVVAACGSGKKGTTAPSGSSSASGSPTTTAGTDLVLATLSDASALVPGSPQRMAFGFFNKEGVLLTTPPAPQIDVSVATGGQTIATLKAAAHATDLPRPYYPVVFTPPQAGVYDLTATVNGTAVQTQVQIPASTTVVGPGQKMIPLDTPTTADQRGVELLCTRNPACPLHDVTLRQALAGGTPVAFLVATPKFCQVAICGPVLDVLVKQKDQFPQIKMLHAEVYPSEADAQQGQQKLTEAVTAYGLTFEPALYLAKADGTIANRIDTIFDGVELHDALAQLAS